MHRYLGRPEEGVKAPEAAVAHGNMVPGARLESLEEQQALLAAGPSLLLKLF